MRWQVFLASTAGKYHRDEGLPCQDAAHWVRRGDWLAAAVCDGAGSAVQGDEGARAIAREVADGALDRALRLVAGEAEQPPVREALLELIGGARAQLRERAAARELGLRDYACTLVGCLAGASGGLLFHVGDGYAIFRDRAARSLLSRPENGEYADQTYFVTDEDWAEHLRITPLPPVEPGDLIGLMSDGVSPFAVDRERSGFFAPFLDPVLAYLRGVGEDAGSRALESLLADDKTNSITGDDKTLLLALAA